MASGNSPPEVGVSGVGVVSAIGQGRTAFTAALLDGRHNFGVMRRPGRQLPASGQRQPDVPAEPTTAFLGAEVSELSLPPSIPSSKMRGASLSGQMALVALQEAWTDAKLDEVDPARIGLIVGGSNFQQRELVNTQTAFAQRPQFLRPVYGLSFMDTDLCGMCTELFGIRAFAHTLGGASASGQLAVIHAIQAVQRGEADVCIAVGALMDLSYWECQGFRSLGAMGSDRHAREPALACRPFDRHRDGFIYGEGCGVLVLEKIASAGGREVAPYARLSGWSVQIDGNRNPNPSFEGEAAAIRQCLARAGLSPQEIDYVNPHGSGSVIGDETELRAISDCGLSHARLNATKSLIGHGLSAAGALELIATVLQMRAGRLHPTRNLHEPIEPSLQWVGEAAVPHTIERALKLSMGFGGINTAICLQRI
jgi:malonyl-ACP decarboxylase